MNKKIINPETFLYVSVGILCSLSSFYFLIQVFNGNFGSLIGLFFSSTLGAASCYQAYIITRDRITGPQILTGKIEYIWKSHGIFSMGKSSYFKINNKIFLTQTALIKDIPKDSNIKITYLPFSKTIISLERTK